MMNDRELLELSAKAAGMLWKRIPVREENGILALWIVDEKGDLKNSGWNPLTDDGDALRLAVKLKLDINYGFAATQINVDSYDWGTETSLVEVTEDGRDDPYAATRRAIVRAAAEIGKDMK